MQSQVLRRKNTAVPHLPSTWFTVQPIKPQGTEPQRAKSVEKQKRAASETYRKPEKETAKSGSDYAQRLKKIKALQLKQLLQSHFTTNAPEKKSSQDLKPANKSTRVPIRAFQETTKVENIEDTFFNTTAFVLKPDPAVTQSESVKKIIHSSRGLRQPTPEITYRKYNLKAQEIPSIYDEHSNDNLAQKSTEADTCESPIIKRSFRIKSHASTGEKSFINSSRDESVVLPGISDQKELIKSFMNNKFRSACENKPNSSNSQLRQHSAQIMETTRKFSSQGIGLGVHLLTSKVRLNQRSKSAAFLKNSSDKRRQGFRELEADDNLTGIQANALNSQKDLPVQQEIMKLTAGDILTERSSNMKNPSEIKRFIEMMKLSNMLSQQKPEFREATIEADDSILDSRKLFKRPSPFSMPTVALTTIDGSRKTAWKIMREKLSYALWKLKELNLEPKTLLEHQGVFSSSSFARPNSRGFLLAVKNGDLHVVEKLLLRDRYLVYEFDNIFMTGLHWAAKLGHVEIAKLLIKKHSDVEARDIIGRTPFYYSLENGNIEIMRHLLNKKCDPWSTQDYNVNEFMNNNKEVEFYVRKTRLVHLAMKMIKKSQIQAFWERHSQFLLEQE